MKTQLRIPLTEHITGRIAEYAIGYFCGEIYFGMERVVFVAPDGRVKKVSFPAEEISLEDLPQKSALIQELYEATKQLQQIIKASNINNN